MLTIGALAKKTGCNIETIRYYERIGLLSPPPRSQSGRRSYEPDEVKQVQFIKRCRDLGFTLKEVRALIELSTSGQENCTRVKQLAEAQATSVRRKMAELAQVENWLAQMVARCSAPQHAGCPILDTSLASADT